jgi:hypothetical protein
MVRLPIAPPRQLRDLAADGVAVAQGMLTMLPRLDSLLDAAAQLLDRVTTLLARIEDSDAAARQVIAEVDTTHRRVRALVDAYGPASVRILAAIDERGIPLLQTLESVAPDLSELLATSRALNEIIGAVPGLGRAKKRADELLDHDGDGAVTAGP